VRITYDLHIHSALSPCAEPEMTPNNIVNMAAIKGLDFIAICDHNAIHNVEPALEVIQRDALDLVLIPGIEVQSKEDVHVVCLFKTINALKSFFSEIDAFKQTIPHNAKKFGDQICYDACDEIIGHLEHSLYGSILLSVDEVVERVQNNGGNCILAHIDRGSYSILANLGFISPELPVKAVEFSPDCNPDELIRRHPYLRRYVHLINSDAHELIQISEAVHAVNVKSKTIEALFETLFGEA
jgi:PHP family Zn ribbon phosphoesterase